MRALMGRCLKEDWALILCRIMQLLADHNHYHHCFCLSWKLLKMLQYHNHNIIWVYWVCKLTTFINMKFKIFGIWKINGEICFYNLKVSKSINNRANTFYKDLLTMSRNLKQSQYLELQTGLLHCHYERFSWMEPYLHVCHFRVENIFNSQYWGNWIHWRRDLSVFGSLSLAMKLIQHLSPSVQTECLTSSDSRSSNDMFLVISLSYFHTFYSRTEYKTSFLLAFKDTHYSTKN